jgi:hypothetical protein
MSLVAVFICKNFKEIVKAFRLERRPSPDMDFVSVEGQLVLCGSDAFTVLPRTFEKYIAETGYTVTLYLCLSDGQGYVPIADPAEGAVADYVNSIAMESSPQVIPWRETNS